LALFDIFSLAKFKKEHLILINMGREGEVLGKRGNLGQITASVLLKLFIDGNGTCPTI